MSAEPPTRTLILGLLAELAGAGATFCKPAAFAVAARKHPAADAPARAGVRAPHTVTVVVDAAPEAALPFARATAAIGAPVTFLLRMARGGATPRRYRGEAFAELAALSHHLGVVVPAGTGAEDLAGAVAGERGRGVRLEVLCPEGNAITPDEAGALHEAAGLPVCLGTTTIRNGQAATVAFTLTVDRGVIRARSVAPGFGILDAPLRELDEAAIACLTDTVARGSCLVGLRLSQLV